MTRRQFVLGVPAAAALADPVPPELVFDGGKPGAPIRALNGVNGGPLAAGGLLDTSARWNEAAFPLARLHDAHWPNADVVDVHAVFPDPAADPARPESYDFERTDEYVKAVHDCGAAISYRLGEGIEHQKAKRHARPPKDPARWAAVCVGIVRHYTQGWAGGFRLPIRYWEVWNEPDNRPSCWTGTDDDYFRLYAATAAALRKEFPAIKVGGPGLGNTGELTGARLEPTPFLKAFLARCAKDGSPLDFLSWHCYTADAAELALRAEGVRAALDAAGFRRTASHLNEWNSLPGGSWDGLKAGEAARERWYAELNGIGGAAFVAAALTLLQDAPIDEACYFTAEVPGMGLFSPHGTPSRAFDAFRAFRDVAGRKRLPLAGPRVPGLTALAGGGDRVCVLLARAGPAGGKVTVRVRDPQWQGATRYEVLTADGERGLRRVSGGVVEGCAVTVESPAPSVTLVRMGADKGG